jgi:SAM-dependent methyltransferase
VRKNKDLKKVYDNVFANGENNFWSFEPIEIHEQVLSLPIYKDKKVLDVGCGSGDVAIGISELGAKSVLGIDYSDEAIKLAIEKNNRDNVIFEVSDYENINETYDVITLVGVLEHIENPFDAVKKLHLLLNEDGKLVFECPTHQNIRGYIWMTLQILFDVPMSLTDINFFSPFDFQEFADNLNMSLEWRTFDFSRGNGERMVVDLEKRLVNALRDAKLDNLKVPKLIEWLKKSTQYDNERKHTGSEGLYILSK